VVENIRDVMAIENTSQFNGVYHVLGGIISPMDGIGPDELNIEDLVVRSGSGSVSEIILALPTTIEGDTTNFYIFKRLKEFEIRVSTIARGISIGDELEYTDEITLGRSIVNRTLYENLLSSR
jgi:recombination protein RecR